MKIVLAADHAGYELKQDMVSYLKGLGYDTLDLGADTGDQPDDYPDFARRLSMAIQDGRAERGVLICGSGVGACIAANKSHGIYASMCHDTYSAHQGVEHDQMNVIVLGARIIGVELAYEVVKAFLNAKFSGEPRHVRRVGKIHAIEDGTPYQEGFKS